PLLVSGLKFLAQTTGLAILAIFRTPPWWVWAASFGMGLWIAHFIAWRELFLLVQELSGRPELSVTTSGFDGHGGLEFYIENSNDHVAVNVSGLDMEFTISQKLQKESAELDRAFGNAVPDLPTIASKWTVRFETIDRVNNNAGPAGVLEYSI